MTVNSDDRPRNSYMTGRLLTQTCGRCLRLAYPNSRFAGSPAKTHLAHVRTETPVSS